MAVGLRRAGARACLATTPARGACARSSSACPDLGVDYLTIFAFSTENWKRTQTEVAGLMALFRRYIAKEMQELVKENVRVRFIGDRARLEPSPCRT